MEQRSRGYVRVGSADFHAQAIAQALLWMAQQTVDFPQFEWRTLVKQDTQGWGVFALTPDGLQLSWPPQRRSVTPE